MQQHNCNVPLGTLYARKQIIPLTNVHMRFHKIIYLIFVLTMFMSTSCFMPQSVIEKYSQCYNNETNGIDTICKINGFYFVKPLNSKYILAGGSIMLYNDGTIVVDVHTYSKTDSLIDELNKGKKVKSVIPDNVRNGKDLYRINTLPSWGTYYIEDDSTIVANIFYYSAMGASGIIEERYKIQNDTTIMFESSIVLVSNENRSEPYTRSYADPEWTIYKFIPLKDKPVSACWLKSKRWFWCDKKEFKVYKKWKKEQWRKQFDF